MVIFTICCIFGLSFGSFRSDPDTRCYRPNFKNAHTSAIERGRSRRKAKVGTGIAG
jgi:hypothetical protein